MSSKAFETAIGKVASLPEATQEQIGRDLLAHIDTLEALRADLQAGIDQLDAGLASDFDVAAIMERAHREHVGK